MQSNNPRSRVCPVCGLRNTFLASVPAGLGLVYWLRCDDCGSEYRVAYRRYKNPRPSASRVAAWMIALFVFLLFLAIVTMHFLGRADVPYHRSALSLGGIGPLHKFNMS